MGDFELIVRGKNKQKVGYKSYQGSRLKFQKKAGRQEVKRAYHQIS